MYSHSDITPESNTDEGYPQEWDDYYWQEIKSDYDKLTQSNTKKKKNNNKMRSTGLAMFFFGVGYVTAKIVTNASKNNY